MLGRTASRVVAASSRRPVFQTARRTLLDKPNTIKSQQAEMQKGATPYLRGEEDPTYLRKSSDMVRYFFYLLGLGARCVRRRGACFERECRLLTC